MSSKITINGITIDGSNIVIKRNRVIVDGKDVTPDAKEINISIVGNVQHIRADCCERIHVTGDTGNVETMGGNVNVDGNINGSVQTMSGDVDCGGSITGNVDTMSGNIKSR